MLLGSRVAVALAWASGYGSDWTLSLGTSVCQGVALEMAERQEKNVYMCVCVCIYM